MSQVADRNILITGGASGIGRQMALKLSALGGRILIWDINPANIDKVLAEV